tara:strand:+ start:43 stop:372 length:330 start_codon:yes stop_codon:yes gene_type:complete
LKRAVQVHEIEDWFGTVCNIYKQILLTEKPVVVALNGVAAGGGFQMALASDQRVAHAGTRMGQPEINAGIPSIMGVGLDEPSSRLVEEPGAVDDGPAPGRGGGDVAGTC